MQFDEERRADKELELLKLLIKGEKEILADRGHDLEDVLAESDRLLSE